MHIWLAELYKKGYLLLKELGLMSTKIESLQILTCIFKIVFEVNCTAFMHTAECVSMQLQ